ncbi:MAG: VirB4 family type IV secretion/conjugal transfer ATPase [Nitrospira sp.]|nr:VirB4 family type IV secretion/conjugal transfer ATPase [Nitrospira sp.]MDH4245602.1 VirB4 family type IV secretion/conjugal transfer ATPase [Nitrospira sp.]MDH4354832.1 VirB4 family type IV secretion/conjugal transfer ATPase [Nitrospira sp.]MDH5317094.1 VirB4 family type IV secretion/conjugal transfer ATPase [Nitrospira sp.]
MMQLTQTIRTRAALKKAAAVQIPASDYIPLGTAITPTVITLTGGEYLACWKLEGITFETSDRSEVLLRKEGLHQFLRSLGGGSFALWSHKIRRVVHERLQGRSPNKFCQSLSDRYYQSFDQHRQMATELYLSILYRPSPSKMATFFTRMTTRTLSQRREQESEQLTIVEDMGKQLEASLSRYGPTRLGTYTKQDVVYSEMLAFLSYLINGVWEEIPLRRAPLASYLPTSRLHFGDKTGMVEIWHPRERKFAGFLDMQEYPQFSEPGMNNGLLYSDDEYIETQSFSFLNKRAALKALATQKGHLIASEDAATREIEQMDQAADDLQSGLIDLGQYHYSLAIFGKTMDSVATSLADARAVFQDGPGFKMARVDVIPECAWFAQIPGNWSLRPREAIITSRNFVCLSPLHNFARGKRIGNPWGEALALFKTPSGQPYYFNFHVSPEDRDSRDEKYPGNTFICGSTGVGKTALELSLIAFATKYEGLRCVVFDKDRGAEIGIRAMGGTYQSLKRGQPTGFNPFQAEPTPQNWQFCEQLLAQLAKQPGDDVPRLTAKEQTEISHAVRAVMSETVSAELRCLSLLLQNLPATGDQSVRARLKRWTRGHALGWVFDNPRDTHDLTNAQLFGYDYTEFLDDPEVRTPIMAYLLHLTERLITGQPFIYVMEEFWKPLQDPMFADFAFNKQKTIRKQSGLGVFVTQSPSDVLGHPIGKTMVEQSVTQIFLPNPRADHEDYVQGFKVTEAEFHIIKNLGEASRLFLVKQGHSSAIVQFDLGGMPDLLHILSGSTDNIALLDRIREDVGDDPQTWLPVFQENILARKRLAQEQDRGPR